jgi:hypothetical protein
MRYILNGKEYTARSAVEILRSIERDMLDYPHKGQPIIKFIEWSLNRVAEFIPDRELFIDTRLNEETLALNFLCLQEEYGIGSLYVMN